MSVIDVHIKPKQVSNSHEGQKYTCRFDPNAPTEKCWLWTITFVRTYTYYGTSPTLALAIRAAKRKIHSLNNLAEQEDEDGQ